MSKIGNNENYVGPMEPHANTSYVCLFDHGGWRRVITLAKFYTFLPGLGYITWLLTVILVTSRFLRSQASSGYPA